MSSYPADNPPELACERCQKSAEVEWVDVSEISTSRASVVPGLMWCRAEGCVDERGSRQTRMPPTPDELEARGSRALDTIRAQLAS